MRHWLYHVGCVVLRAASVHHHHGCLVRHSWLCHQCTERRIHLSSETCQSAALPLLFLASALLPQIVALSLILGIGMLWTGIKVIKHLNIDVQR